jgi:hypothetical protein
MNRQDRHHFAVFHEAMTDQGATPTDVDMLCSIHRSLHTIAERWCNEEMSDATVAKVAAREAMLERKAYKIAASFGCNIRTEGDPRGPVLYIVCPPVDGFAREYAPTI